MRDVEGIARARIVDVIPLVLWIEAVIGGVVDALERQRGAALVALGRMVVDDVEDDLEARVMQARDHFLEFLQSLRAVGRISRMGAKKPMELYPQ